MKSPPDPESMRALARISLLPESNITESIRRESVVEEPVKVMAATEAESVGGSGSGSESVGAVGLTWE